jgi:protoheme IX farnesyltransferase
VIAQVAVSRSLIRDYIALTKPRIVVLLLLTALGGMFLAAQGAPEASIALLVLLGGAMASGGANALNHYLDRDIDGVMRRTRNRPVASGRVQPRQALAFGVALNLIAFVMLGALVNPLSAALTLGATLFYVFVYTKGLKRSTPQNIVIGGAAGAIPPVVGWAAVTGGLDLPALYLFAIIFFWTPPHFWALALLLKDDYASANVPMLPVVAGVDETKRHIFLYTLLLAALTLMFFTTSAVGLIYLATSSALSIAFIYYAWRLLRQPEAKGAKGLYLYSLLYMGLLFVAVIVDSVVRV